MTKIAEKTGAMRVIPVERKSEKSSLRKQYEVKGSGGGG